MRSAGSRSLFPADLFWQSGRRETCSGCSLQYNEHIFRLLPCQEGTSLCFHGPESSNLHEGQKPRAASTRALAEVFDKQTDLAYHAIVDERVQCLSELSRSI